MKAVWMPCVLMVFAGGSIASATFRPVPDLQVSDTAFAVQAAYGTTNITCDDQLIYGDIDTALTNVQSAQIDDSISPAVIRLIAGLTPQMGIDMQVKLTMDFTLTADGTQIAAILSSRSALRKVNHGTLLQPHITNDWVAEGSPTVCRATPGAALRAN